MLDDPEMRLLGLRGLYLEAERLGDRAAARHYAGRAADIAPQLGWAIDSTLEEKTARGDWDGALKLVDAQKSTRQVERDAVNRRRAVLLTAKAQDLLDTDLTAAKAAAVEANRLAPDFAPAAVVAAKALFRQNDIRKGAKILEAAWKAEPHPEIADLYVHARPGDAVLDRLSRAQKLQSLKQNHVESSLAVARAALDAQEFKTAREAAEAAIRMQPREGAYLLLADIEEAETGDQGRVRQYLAKAVRAPRDPAWVADGFVVGALGAGLAGHRQARRVRMARAGRAARPVDRAGRREQVHPSLAPPAPQTGRRSIEPDARRAGAASAAAASRRRCDRRRRVIDRRRRRPTIAEADDEAGNRRSRSRLPDDPGVDPAQEQDKSQRRFRLF